MKKTLSVLAGISLLLASCSNKQALETKVWKLVNVKSASTSSFLNHMEGDMANIGGYNRFLRFYKDGSYTGKLTADFDYGKWEASGSKLTLHSHDKSDLQFNVSKVNEEVLIMNIEKLEQLGEKLEFQFEGKPVIESKDDDAYSLQNNSWQLKATKKETNAQILDRVKKHVLCQLLYIQKAIENKEETISIGQFASPIKFYGNGLGLKPLNTVPEEWSKTFFDNEDMNIAYEYLEKGFEAKISVPDTQNRFIMYKGIFEQLYLNIRKLQP